MTYSGGTGWKGYLLYKPVLSVDFGILNARIHDSFPEWLMCDPTPMFEDGQLELFINPCSRSIISQMSQILRWRLLEWGLSNKLREKSQ